MKTIFFSLLFTVLAATTQAAESSQKRSVSCRLIVNDVPVYSERVDLDDLPQEKDEGLGQVAVMILTNPSGSTARINITRADLFSKPTVGWNEVVMHVTHEGKTYTTYGIFETRFFLTNESKKSELESGQEVYAACSVYPRDEIK